MTGFNPDGSIRMPAKLARKKADEDNRMRSGRCMKIRKDLISTISPKSCALHITLSDRISDTRFIHTIFQEFNNQCKVPAGLIQLSDKEFRINIGTCFSRCSDCTSLIQRYRSFMGANVIEDSGSCEYNSNRQASFAYEDHFD